MKATVALTAIALTGAAALGLMSRPASAQALECDWTIVQGPNFGALVTWVVGNQDPPTTTRGQGIQSDLGPTPRRGGSGGLGEATQGDLANCYNTKSEKTIGSN